MNDPLEKRVNLNLYEKKWLLKERTPNFSMLVNIKIQAAQVLHLEQYELNKEK